MTGPCFVDANVFVYTLDARDPKKHRRAEQWLDELWRTRSGRTSAQALAEFYAVTTRKLSWWDAMIVAAAQLQDCVLLLTEDLQDGAAFGGAGVTRRSPEFGL